MKMVGGTTFLTICSKKARDDLYLKKTGLYYQPISRNNISVDTIPR